MTNPIKIISKSEYLKKNKKPNQKEVWEEIADLWGEYRQGKIPIVAEFLKGKSGKVIDLGCGSGRNMIGALLEKDFGEKEYYEVDFSKTQLKNAEEYSKKQKIKAFFFENKADDLKMFENERFDYGLFIAALHCLESKEERENSLKEFYRVLKKNAEALISVWNSEDERFDDIGNKGEVYLSWKKDGKEHMRYYYLFSKEEFVDLLKKTGFKIIEFYSSRERDRFSKKNWIVRIGK
jgi:ubiquinone/menaquinone biosynthesis C-methylase UbiE